MKFEVQILGCGSSLGVPVLGCQCKVCTGDVSQNIRNRSSLLISSKDLNSKDQKILIDSGPDVRSQLLKNGIQKLNTIIITHAHADHYIGLNELLAFAYKMSDPIVVYTSQESAKTLLCNFGYLFKQYFKLIVVEPNETINMYGLNVTFIRLLHGDIENMGIRIGDFAYLNDLTSIPEESIANLKGVVEVIIDAKKYKDTRGHIGVYSALTWLHNLGATKGYITNMSHELCYKELREKLPSNIEPCHDKMVLRF